VPAVAYTLQLEGAPASPTLLAALQQVEVEDHADLADMLRLRLAASVRESGSGWTFLDDDLFPRLAHLRVEVTVGRGPAEPLIDAYVVDLSTDLSDQPGRSTLEVVGMDPTVLMNLEEKVRPWPNMADADVANAIFGDYGFTPVVDPTQPARPDVDHTPIQRGTDIRFLRELAARNGFECYIQSARSGPPEGHFHAPRLDDTPQGVLSVNMGPATNVNRFQARFDMLRPTTAQVTGLDIESQAEQPAAVESAALPALGQGPAGNGDRPRRVLLSRTGLAQTGELQTYAQAVVDRSHWAIRAEGELNTVAYGGLLRAKQTVLVRGAGRQFSGPYYVEKVLHTITGQAYTQQFTLRRNALGLSGQERFGELVSG
jgi:phage protein D